MKSAPIPENETERLKSLKEHQILDTLPEEVYDDITKIASLICGTPMALITFIDKDRQWFESTQGLEASETPRETSFCAHAILNPEEPFVIEDARYDERFFDNPVTTGDPHVVFYAGVPVKDDHGLPLGTLCVIDQRPREISDDKIEALKALGKLVTAHLTLRKVKLSQNDLENQLRLAKEKAVVIDNEILELEKELNSRENAHLMTIRNASKSIQNPDSNAESQR